MAAAKLLRAKASFVCEVEGREVLVHVGDVIASDHGAAEGREELFGPVEPEPDLEVPEPDAEPEPPKRRRRKRS